MDVHGSRGTDLGSSMSIHPVRRLCQPPELLTPLPLRLLASNWTPAVRVVLKLMWDML